jgi:hypothetical protein
MIRKHARPPVAVTIAAGLAAALAAG